MPHKQRVQCTYPSEQRRGTTTPPPCQHRQSQGVTAGQRFNRRQSPATHWRQRELGHPANLIIPGTPPCARSARRDRPRLRAALRTVRRAAAEPVLPHVLRTAAVDRNVWVAAEQYPVAEVRDGHSPGSEPVVVLMPSSAGIVAHISLVSWRTG